MSVVEEFAVPALEVPRAQQKGLQLRKRQEIEADEGRVNSPGEACLGGRWPAGPSSYRAAGGNGSHPQGDKANAGEELMVEALHNNVNQLYSSKIGVSFHPQFQVSETIWPFSFYFILFIYLLLAALGLRCCARAFSSCGEWGLPFVVARGLLIAVASLVVEHGL